MSPCISFEVIAEAIRFYESKGFQYIDVPWTVSEDAMHATLPKDARLFDTMDGSLVGSAEQSFIDMHLADILPPGRYCACTPCFRDELAHDAIHFRRFMKVELIDCRPNHCALEIMATALQFFQSYLDARVVHTDEGFDIVTDQNVELGSYGYRSFRDFRWAYGTGVAEPRLSQHVKVGGYHQAIIRRGVLGTIDKIQEEVKEYMDAEKQNNPIMGLVELSDLVGAVEALLKEKHPGTTMDDLLCMAHTTRRAFEVGRR